MNASMKPTGASNRRCCHSRYLVVHNFHVLISNKLSAHKSGRVGQQKATVLCCHRNSYSENRHLADTVQGDIVTLDPQTCKTSAQLPEEFVQIAVGRAHTLDLLVDRFQPVVGAVAECACSEEAVHPFSSKWMPVRLEVHDDRIEARLLKLKLAPQFAVVLSRMRIRHPLEYVQD